MKGPQNDRLSGLLWGILGRPPEDPKAVILKGSQNDRLSGLLWVILGRSPEDLKAVICLSGLLWGI